METIFEKNAPTVDEIEKAKKCESCKKVIKFFEEQVERYIRSLTSRCDLEIKHHNDTKWLYIELEDLRAQLEEKNKKEY